ncbi:MAG: hypothetical protein PHI27_09760 [Eubacteriales bacterium]|nr:hypothetical protein [Eubacteriales bacterium]MDD3882528.1 hypothetical protein [Eubacteriales bacterium]MDD4512828.1 hypothetical protein [Eubacteriales bacterium]
MKYVAAVFLAVFGALMALRPDLAWKYAESWKHSAEAAPAKWYLTAIRIAGIVLIAGAIIAFFVD